MAERTPTETLRAAASKLRALARHATYRDGRWMVDVAGPAASTSWLGPSHDVLTATWRQAAWVDTAKPALAEPLAIWLNREAKDVRPRTGQSALAVARIILGEGEASRG